MNLSAPGWVPLTAALLALGLYSLAVWAARLGGGLRGWQTKVLWAALAVEAVALGTAGQIGADRLPTNPAGIAGVATLALLFFHASWAQAVLRQRGGAMREAFRRISPIVWAITLVPLAAGMVLELAK